MKQLAVKLFDEEIEGTAGSTKVEVILPRAELQAKTFEAASKLVQFVLTMPAGIHPSFSSRRRRFCCAQSIIASAKCQ